MDMQHRYGHGHAAMEMTMQPIHGHTVWVWTCSIDVDKPQINEHGHGHWRWNWRRNDMDRDMKLEEKWTWTWTLTLKLEAKWTWKFEPNRRKITSVSSHFEAKTNLEAKSEKIEPLVSLKQAKRHRSCARNAQELINNPQIPYFFQIVTSPLGGGEREQCKTNPEGDCAKRGGGSVEEWEGI